MSFIKINVCLSTCAERLCGTGLYLPAFMQIDALPILAQKEVKDKEEARER
jgi:hypothetical protein